MLPIGTLDHPGSSELRHTSGRVRPGRSWPPLPASLLRPPLLARRRPGRTGRHVAALRCCLCRPQRRRARGPDFGAPWARPASPVWSGAPTRSPVTVRVARSRHCEIRERDEPQRPMLLSTMTLPDFVFFHIFFYFFNHVSPSFYFHRQETLGAAPVPGGGAAWTPAAAGSRVAGLSPELRPGSTSPRQVRASQRGRVAGARTAGAHTPGASRTAL